MRRSVPSLTPTVEGSRHRTGGTMVARQRGLAKVGSLNLRAPSTSSRDAAKWRHRLWSLTSRRKLAEEVACRIGDHGYGMFDCELRQWRGGLHPTDLPNVLARCRFDLGVGCDRIKSSKRGDVSTHGTTVDLWFGCGSASTSTLVEALEVRGQLERFGPSLSRRQRTRRCGRDAQHPSR